jgi:hypothetical protein
MLNDAEKRLSQAGISLWMAGLSPDVLVMVRRSPLGETLGRERLFYNLEEAVARYQELIKEDRSWLRC